MIRLTKKIEVKIPEAEEKYGLSTDKWYEVIGTMETNRKVDGETKASDHFLIVNDEGKISSPFISKCKVRPFKDPEK